jgi:hypothetical protein
MKILVNKQSKESRVSIGWLAKYRYRTLKMGEIIENGDFLLEGKYLTPTTCVGDKAPHRNQRQYIRILKGDIDDLS